MPEVQDGQCSVPAGEAMTAPDKGTPRCDAFAAECETRNLPYRLAEWPDFARELERDALRLAGELADIKSALITSRANLAHWVERGKKAESALASREGCGVYIASRVKHAETWKRMRTAGAPIISTWIDEAGDDETDDFGELWERITSEIRGAKSLVFYADKDDFPLKGALVEVGIAMSLAKPIFVVSNAVIEGRTMRPLGSWILGRNVTRLGSIESAMLAAVKEKPSA